MEEPISGIKYIAKKKILVY